MLTHDDAIEYLRAHGLDATRRKWALGDCVTVLAFPGSPTEIGIAVYGFVAWLVPHDESTWDLVHVVRQHERRRNFASLDEACEGALRLVQLHDPTDTCPKCAGVRDIELRELPRRGERRWSFITSCRSCRDHAASYGDGALPEHLRALELARNGTWFVATTGDFPTSAWDALREHLALDDEAVSTLKQHAPGHVFEGTFAEAVIVRELVAKHGGEAELDSPPDALHAPNG